MIMKEKEKEKKYKHQYKKKIKEEQMTEARVNRTRYKQHKGDQTSLHPDYQGALLTTLSRPRCIVSNALVTTPQLQQQRCITL